MMRPNPKSGALALSFRGGTDRLKLGIGADGIEVGLRFGPFRDRSGWRPLPGKAAECGALLAGQTQVAGEIVT